MTRPETVKIKPLLLLVPVMALAACSPAGDKAGTPDLTGPGVGATATEEPAPVEFTGTAWRVEAPDGARYTTYLDEGGTYRDLRNGDPWQVGSWEYGTDTKTARLCFTPDAENGVERCWEAGRMRDGKLHVTADSGTEIELEKVDYRTPESAGDEA